MKTVSATKTPLATKIASSMATIWALCLRNLKAFVRNKPQLIFSIIFPFFFIYIFSSIFSFMDNPFSYMLAGIIIATVFDFSLRISSTTIDDITSGFMKEALVSPVSRLTIAAGQFMSSAIISTLQGILILTVGFFIDFRVTSPLTVLYIILGMIFVGLVFSGFGLFIATKTKNTQTFQVVSMAITMPMTFISGAYIPFHWLPQTLVFIGSLNPMTYAVAFFRAVALEKAALPSADLIDQELAHEVGGFIITPLVSIVILLAFGLLFLWMSTRSFVKTDFSKINRSKNDAIEW
jgi:ABC-2 type transport system permease protein